MASFHFSMKIGRSGAGAAHASYISRDGKYEHLLHSEKSEKLEHLESGNMPRWAHLCPLEFWGQADQRERKNGPVYREFELALPNELTPEQSVQLVRDFVKSEIGDRHAFTFAIHNGKASVDGEQQNRNAHIMFSERLRDGIERGPDTYFKRAAAAYSHRVTKELIQPDAAARRKGGCAKSNVYNGTRAERRQALVNVRTRFADLTNEYLARYGHADRVTHLSLKSQGIDRVPESHLGPKYIQMMSDRQISDLLTRRIAEGESERARVHDASELESAREDVSKIDITGDLSAALADRARQSSLATLATLAAGASRFAQAHEQRTKERQAQAERERVLKEHQQVEARANDIRTQRQSEAAKAEAVAKAAAKLLLQRCAQHSAECSLNKFKMNQEMTFGYFEIEAILHRATKKENKNDLANWFNKQSLSDNTIDVVLDLAGRAANINRNSEFHNELIKMLNDAGIHATPERIALDASKSAEEAALKNRERNNYHDNDNDMGM